MDIKNIVCYVFAINIISFLAFGWDKRKARKGRWRISERCLLFLAALGGSVGAWAGIYVFRHKTLKRKFTIGVPAILAVQVVCVMTFFYYL